MKSRRHILLMFALLLLLGGCRRAPAAASPPLAAEPTRAPLPHISKWAGHVPRFPSSSPSETGPAPELVSLPEVVAPSPESIVPSSGQQNTKLYVLMYHSFTEDESKAGSWTTTASCFREDLQWLVDQGYGFVLPSELVAGTPLPEKAVMLTFDDGYADNYSLAYPILREFGAKAVISLIVGQQDRDDPAYLSWDMCREMAGSGLVEFGSHTYQCHQGNGAFSTHGIQRWPNESREEYEARVLPDLQKSIDLLEEELGQSVLLFAYPNGKKDSWAAGYIQEHFSITLVTANGVSDVSKGLYSLKRYNMSPTSRPGMYLK